MQGDKKVIEYLNLGLKGELTAINQYFLHYRMLENWGLTKMAQHERQESMEEMVHADKLIQRILLLNGLPNLQDLGKLYIGQNVKEVLEGDLKLEREGIANYRAGIKVAEDAKDYVTAQLFKDILKEEEGHEDHLETQLNLFETLGPQNYAQLQSGAFGEIKEK